MDKGDAPLPTEEQLVDKIVRKLLELFPGLKGLAATASDDGHGRGESEPRSEGDKQDLLAPLAAIPAGVAGAAGAGAAGTAGAAGAAGAGGAGLSSLAGQVAGNVATGIATDLATDAIKEPFRNPEESQRFVHPVHYRRLERELRELQSRYVRSECQHQLEKLIDEGYQMDMDREVATMASLSPEQRTDRINYIRQYYRKAPIGGGFLPVFSQGGKPSSMDDWADRVIQYQRDHNCSWEEAEAAIRAGKI